MPFSSRTAIAVSAFSILADEQALPTTEDTYAGPYLIGDDGYFWVGTGGNKLNGKYKSITLKGDTGADGKSAYDVYVEVQQALVLMDYLLYIILPFHHQVILLIHPLQS